MTEAAVTQGSAGVAERAMQWAASEGWNPGLHDATAFRAADPRGWFSMRTREGEICTTLSAINYGPEFGFMGLFITRPEVLRGQGFGAAVWQAGIEYLSQCRTIGLDGVLERESTYERWGFSSAFVTSRYRGPAAALACRSVNGYGHEALSVGAKDARELASFESSHCYFPARRQEFLTEWLALPASASVIIRGQGGNLAGWGTVRRAVDGYRIGPVEGDDPRTVVAVLGELAQTLPAGADVAIDVPESNRYTVQLLEQLEFAPVFQCVRMYRGSDPNVDLAGVAGLASFELG